MATPNSAAVRATCAARALAISVFVGMQLEDRRLATRPCETHGQRRPCLSGADDDRVEVLGHVQVAVVDETIVEVSIPQRHRGPPRRAAKPNEISS
jgi:hypothetical protein